MATNHTYFPRSTAQQRKLLFETWEATGSVKQACERAHLSQVTFYLWKPRFAKEGYAGLERTGSHRPQHLARKKSAAIEGEVIGMRQAHPDWGKKRIEQEMAQAHQWVAVVSANTVKRILSEAGLWKPAQEAGKKRTLAGGSTRSKADKR